MDEESTLKRILNAPLMLAMAALCGFGLILLTFALVFWIEHRGINTAISLEQGSSVALSVPADRVDPANDGRLVHMTGEASALESLMDAEFGIAIQALRLVREVEVFQWIEKRKETKKDKNTTVVYTYTTDWSRDKPQQSFHEPQGHINPPDRPYADVTLDNPTVKIGAFSVTLAQVQRLTADEIFAVPQELLDKVPEHLQAKVKIDNEGRLFVGSKPVSHPDAPQVGDVRIRFKIAKQPQVISLVAKQSQDSFEPYIPEAGEKIDLLRPGAHDLEAMFAHAHSSNELLTWMVRVIGLMFLAVGLGLFLRWRVNSASGNPPDGFVAHFLIVLYATLLAVPLLLIVIGLRWVFQHWLVGSGLLGGGLVVLLAMIVLTRARKSGLFAGVFGGGKSWSKKEREYFREIALDPDNAELRLEFAAHLTKNGDPMGEFIRMESEMQSLPEDDETRAELDARGYELLEKYGRSWFAPLRSLGLEPPPIAGMFFPAQWMHHGIIDEIALEQEGILPAKAAKLFAAAPGLRVLRFSYRPDWAGMAKLSLMQQIGEIHMSSLTMDLDDLKAITTSPNFENLAVLDIPCNKIYIEAEDQDVYLGPKGAAAIANSSTLTNLRELDFGYSKIGPKGAISLANAANLATLTALNLSVNQIGDKGISALASSAHLKKLKTLILEDNEIGEAGAKALASSPHLLKLTTLVLSGNAIGAEGVKALSESPNFVKLTTLKLYNTNLDETALAFLAGSPNLGRLEVLVLDRNELDSASAIALAKSTSIRKLKELSLSYNQIGDAGLKALAKWPGLARVKKLNLRENLITAEGVKALAASPYLDQLLELDLSANEIGFGGARALADSPGLAGLKTLIISETNLNTKASQLLQDRFGDGVYT